MLTAKGNLRHHHSNVDACGAAQLNVFLASLSRDLLAAIAIISVSGLAKTSEGGILLAQDLESEVSDEKSLPK